MIHADKLAERRQDFPIFLSAGFSLLLRQRDDGSGLRTEISVPKSDAGRFMSIFTKLTSFGVRCVACIMDEGRRRMSESTLTNSNKTKIVGPSEWLIYHGTARRNI